MAYYLSTCLLVPLCAPFMFGVSRVVKLRGLDFGARTPFSEPATQSRSASADDRHMTRAGTAVHTLFDKIPHPEGVLLLDTLPTY